MSRTYLQRGDPTTAYRRALGRRIRQRMADLDLTQERLGEMVGVSHVSVSDWTNPLILAMPQANLIGPLAKALRCDMVWLITGRG